MVRFGSYPALRPVSIRSRLVKPLPCSDIPLVREKPNENERMGAKGIRRSSLPESNCRVRSERIANRFDLGGQVCGAGDETRTRDFNLGKKKPEFVFRIGSKEALFVFRRIFALRM